MYPSRAIHVFIFATNIVLRLFWIWRLKVTNFTNETLLLITVVAEGSRRFMWNLLRMENEQLSNCGLFRAVIEIPLPYESSAARFYRTSSSDDDKISSGETQESFEIPINNESTGSNQFTVQSSGVKSTIIANQV